MKSIPEIVVAAIANTLWQSAAVVAVAWLATRFAPRMNAATRHLVWWAVLAAIVLMPFAQRRAVRTDGHAIVISDVRPIVLPSPRAAVARATAAVFVPAASKPAPVRSGGVWVRAGSLPAWIFALWVAVFLVQAGRIAWSYRYLSGIKRRARQAEPETRRDFDVWMLACGVHRPAQLLISNEIVSPMAVGFRTPAVIVPESLLGEFTDDELDHVLLHELAHIARRDDWSNLAARAGWALLALHPPAAWALRQIEREREIACDDWVVAATGEARPYAASLARLFEICFTRRRALLATGMAERASQLGDRIEMLLRRQREFTAHVNVGRVVGCAAVLMLIMAAGSRAPRWIAFAKDSGMESKAAPAQSRRAPQARPGSNSQQQGGSFLAALVAAGYGNLPVDDIIALKNNGITGDFLAGVAQSGWGKLSPQELIDLRQHGVSPDYLRGVHESGLTGITVKDLIVLRDNGVVPMYVKDIESAGLGTYTLRQVIDFRHHNVRPELLRALKEAGFKNVEAADVMQLQDNGVGERNLNEAKQYSSSLSLKQIIRLKQAGVI